MSIRTINSAVVIATAAAALALAFALLAPGTVRAAAAPAPPAAEDKPLSPVLEQAIVEKEKQVVAARREAIGLLEAYLRDSAHSKEQAEALYKLAELYWEDSKASYLDRMGRYQAAVTACPNNHDACPQVPRRPPTADRP